MEVDSVVKIYFKVCVYKTSVLSFKMPTVLKSEMSEICIQFMIESMLYIIQSFDARTCWMLESINRNLRKAYTEHKALLWIKFIEKSLINQSADNVDNIIVFDLIKLIKGTFYREVNQIISLDQSAIFKNKQERLSIFASSSLTITQKDGEEKTETIPLMHMIAKWGRASTLDLCGWIFCLAQLLGVCRLDILRILCPNNTTCLYQAVKDSNVQFVRVACLVGGPRFVSMPHEPSHENKKITILWTVVENKRPFCDRKRKSTELIFDLLVECGGANLVLQKDTSEETVFVEAVLKKFWHAMDKLFETDSRVVVINMPVRSSLRRFSTYAKTLKAQGRRMSASLNFDAPVNPGLYNRLKKGRGLW